MRQFIHTTLNPSIYHGFKSSPPFFEGWYFKFVDNTEQHRYAIIPGIFKNQDPSKNHAFIQLLDGVTGQATYHEYPIDQFWAHPEKFEVRVGNSFFSKDSIQLNIKDDLAEANGTLSFSTLVPWPVTLTAPGIMGWYAWVPFMECYHGVVSLDHQVYGSLNINGANLNFDNGRGYIEKDWGQAFPSGYIWQQSNHFNTPGTSLTASIALIPFLGRTFPGFLVGLWHHGTLYRMTTYTGAITEKLKISDTHINWVVTDRKHRIEMHSERVSGGLLMAPTRQEMHKRVDETINSRIEVRFSLKSGETLYHDIGRIAALEVHGDIEKLITT